MKFTCLIAALLFMSCANADQGTSHVPHTATGVMAIPANDPSSVTLDISDENIVSESHASSGNSRYTPDQIALFAKQLEKTLAEKGAHVAIVANMDQPASERPEGMRYTHVAFAVYSLITTKNGRKLPGYAIYALQQEDKHRDMSELIQRFPSDFYSDTAELQAGIIIPTPKLQQRLLDVINSPTYSTLHDPHYSLIANPYTLGAQNDAEHTLDVVAAALYQTSNIKRIKANEIAYFKAQPVNINPIRLKLGSLFNSDISTSDHPGSPEIATFETLAIFLQKFNKGSEVMNFTLQSK